MKQTTKKSVGKESLFVYFKQKQLEKRGYRNNKQAHILFS